MALSPRILDIADETTAVTAEGIVYGKAGAEPIIWAIAEEVPVSLMYNSVPYAVMMASPADLQDFAIGFALSEGILPSFSDIRQALVMPVEGGFAVDIAVDQVVLDKARKPRRAMEGRSGCGICGVAEIGETMRRQPPVRKLDLDPACVAQAFSELPDYQPMNRVNRSVHAAAWCDLEGKIIRAREDVGRHNALDKLLGALARADTDTSEGFVVMSSRCSFELVQKAAMLGVRSLATISAPTSLALSLAGDAGMTLAARAGDSIVIFSPERVRHG